MLKFYGRGRLSDPLAEEPPEDDYEDEDLDSEGDEKVSCSGSRWSCQEVRGKHV